MIEELPTLRLDVLGAGTVGSQVVRLPVERSEEFATRSGTRIYVGAVLVRTSNAPRNAQIAPELLTTDPAEATDGMDIAIELTGDIEPAHAHVPRALNAGISVVTGDKALLSAHKPELRAVADASGADFYYEAAVAGAIPAACGLRELLAGGRITKVISIVNGTTNFIPDVMTARSLSYEAALERAQGLGLVETDPSADVKGLDAAAKCTILVSLTLCTRIGTEDVKVEGITRITAEDMEGAAFSDRIIRLFAVAERWRNDQGVEGISVRVHLTLVPIDSPLANVDGASSTILAKGENTDRLMLCDQGADGTLTVSAVLSDLVAVAHRCAYEGHVPREFVYARLPLLESGENLSRFQIHLQVENRPDVFAGVVGLFASDWVLIQALHQRDGTHDGASVITLMAHHVEEADLWALITALKDSDSVRSVISTLHVEGK